jgi:hypothetical protein
VVLLRLLVLFIDKLFRHVCVPMKSCGNDPMMVDLCRLPVSQRFMEASVVVELEVRAEPREQRKSRLVVVKVHVFVLHAPPEPFDEHIVQRSSAAIHADCDLRIKQRLEKRLARELCALVRVEDPRRASTQCLLENACTEIGVLRVGDPPGKDVTAEPVDDCHQVHEAACHGDVRQIGAPHMVRLVDPQPPEQIGVDLVILCSCARFRPWIHRVNAHEVHEAGNSLVVHQELEFVHRHGHFPNPKERMRSILPVDSRHQGEGPRVNGNRHIVQTRTRQSKKLALMDDAQLAVQRIDTRTASIKGQRQTLFLRKSRSTFSRPISSYRRAMIASFSS